MRGWKFLTTVNRSHSSVKCDAFYPFRHVGLWNASAYHAFKVDNEVKHHFVNIVSINQYDVFMPFRSVHICKGKKKIVEKKNEK